MFSFCVSGILLCLGGYLDHPGSGYSAGFGILRQPLESLPRPGFSWTARTRRFSAGRLRNRVARVLLTASGSVGSYSESAGSDYRQGVLSRTVSALTAYRIRWVVNTENPPRKWVPLVKTRACRFASAWSSPGAPRRGGRVAVRQARAERRTRDLEQRVHNSGELATCRRASVLMPAKRPRCIS